MEMTGAVREEDRRCVGFGGDDGKTSDGKRLRG